MTYISNGRHTEEIAIARERLTAASDKVHEPCQHLRGATASGLEERKEWKQHHDAEAPYWYAVFGTVSKELPARAIYRSQHTFLIAVKVLSRHIAGWSYPCNLRCSTLKGQAIQIADRTVGVCISSGEDGCHHEPAKLLARADRCVIGSNLWSMTYAFTM